MRALHEMMRISNQERGMEMWRCSQCKRRLLLRRPPDFEKIVIDPGDLSAAHVGGTGGLRPMAVAAQPAPSGKLPAQDRDWLAEHGIGWEHPQ